MDLKYDTIKIILLLLGIQLYLALIALVFQKTESIRHPKNLMDKELRSIPLESLLKLRGPEQQRVVSALLKKLRYSYQKQYEFRAAESFSNFTSAYIFALTSITTIGNSGLTLSSWKSRLFYIVSIPVGFAAYLALIVSVSKLLIEAFILLQKQCIKSKDATSFPYIKSVLFLSILNYLLIQFGGLWGVIQGKSYFNGVYVTVDMMVSTGEETIYKMMPKTFPMCLLFSLFIIIIHTSTASLIYAVIRSWIEFIDAIDCLDICDKSVAWKTLFSHNTYEVINMETVAEDSYSQPHSTEKNLEPYTVPKADNEGTENRCKFPYNSTSTPLGFDSPDAEDQDRSKPKRLLDLARMSPISMTDTVFDSQGPHNENNTQQVPTKNNHRYTEDDIPGHNEPLEYGINDTNSPAHSLPNDKMHNGEALKADMSGLPDENIAGLNTSENNSARSPQKDPESNSGGGLHHSDSRTSSSKLPPHSGASSPSLPSSYSNLSLSDFDPDELDYTNMSSQLDNSQDSHEMSVLASSEELTPTKRGGFKLW